jgi:glycine/D-amino acid oxidase-like deaminating enzyme
VATAFSGNGMTYAMISGILLSDLIAGRKNPWAGIYDPKRRPTVKQLVTKGRDYVAEMWNGAGKNVFRKKPNP